MRPPGAVSPTGETIQGIQRIIKGTILGEYMEGILKRHGKTQIFDTHMTPRISVKKS